MITTINEWKNFLNENNKNLFSVSEIAGKIANIFPYEKINKSADKRYCYGETYTFADGSTEKGYVIDICDMRVSGAWLLLSQFNSQALEKFETLFIPGIFDKGHGLSFDNVRIIVKKANMISSGRSEYMYANVWYGDSWTGNTTIISTSESFKENHNIETWHDNLSRKIDEKASSLTGDNLISDFFKVDMISGSKLLNFITTHKSQDSRDMGHGSAASTKVYHKIYKEYDFREFVKLYGIDNLKQLMYMEGYWMKRHFKSITEEGIMTTDESWVDTYD